MTRTRCVGRSLIADGWLLIALLIGGCDKLPWPSGKPEQETGTAAAPGAAIAAPSVPPEEILATVNGTPLSKADLELRIQELKLGELAAGRTWTPLTPEQLELLLNQLVENEIVSQDALARGLDRDTETQQRWAYLRRSFFAQEWLRRAQERAEVGSAQIEAFYQQNRLGFRVPERRKLRQLSVASEAQAKQALSQLLTGAVEFSSLAQQISLAPTAAGGGLLDSWVLRANDHALLQRVNPDAARTAIALDPSLEAAAFAIDQVNGLSNYVKGADNRFHLFQLVEREAERERPLTEVWDQVKNLLVLQNLQQAADELRGKAKVERFPERLSAVTP